MNKTYFFLVIVFALMVSACGQSGPLYLPQNYGQQQANQHKNDAQA